MQILKSALSSLGLVSVIGLLGGCGSNGVALPSSQPPSAAQAVADRRGSWMADDAKSQDLLYVADLGTDHVNVYSYPGGRLKGVLKGFSAVHHECVDAARERLYCEWERQRTARVRAWRYRADKEPTTSRGLLTAARSIQTPETWRCCTTRRRRARPASRFTGTRGASGKNTRRPTSFVAILSATTARAIYSLTGPTCTLRSKLPSFRREAKPSKR